MPLDIEIFLRVAPTKHPLELSSVRHRRTTSSPLTPIISPPWNSSLGSHQISSHYAVAHPLPPPPLTTAPIVMPSSPSSSSDGWGSPFGGHTQSERPTNAVSRVSMHWGHIAFFYLVEQMHRWERFVFRFDKQFTSMGALKSINGTRQLTKRTMMLMALLRRCTSFEGVRGFKRRSGIFCRMALAA